MKRQKVEVNRIMREIYISTYHYVRDLKHSRYPKIKGLDIELFRQQVDFLCENFNVITMEQVIESVKTGASLPERAALITFDDGYTDNFAYALPILEEHKIQGSFFIPAKAYSEHKLLDVNKIHYILASADTSEIIPELKKKLDHYRGDEFNYPEWEELYNEFAIADRFDTADTIFVKRLLQNGLPERLRNIICSELLEEFVGVSEEKLAYELYMTEDQLRMMKRCGMFIGLHGYDHYWLAKIPEEQMRADIDKSIEIMSEFIDRDSWVMNYPNGDYGPAVIDHVKKRGACLGLSVDIGVADLDKDDLFALPRFDCNDFPPKSDNYLKYGEKA